MKEVKHTGSVDDPPSLICRRSRGRHFTCCNPLSTLYFLIDLNLTQLPPLITCLPPSRKETPSMAAASSTMADQTAQIGELGTPETLPAETSTPAEGSGEQPFPFMKLPLELRTKVYKETLVMPGTIVMNIDVEVRIDCDIHNPPHRTYKPLNVSVLDLCSTSRAVHHESLPVFFRYNLFHFDTCDDLVKFFSCVGPTSRRNVTSVYFGFRGRAPAKAANALRQFVGLNYLTIEISGLTLDIIPHPYAWSPPCLMKANGLAGLLKIRGIKELEIIQSPTVAPNLTFLADSIPAFKEALQVLKQPHKPALLTRQEKKDYPQSRWRTVFGKANVNTRAERKFMGL